MKKGLVFTFIIALVSLIACKDNKKQTEEKIEDVIIEQDVAPTDVKVLKIALEPKSESSVSGTVTFTQENGTVTMVAEMTGLTPGSHAIHIHEKSDCSSPDGKSTGGHWNPTNQPHGGWGAPEVYHKGDIGNFTADDEGKGSITFSTDEWCLGCGDETKDLMGKGVIVHAGTDDLTTQPTGDAGGRVSCAGIIQ